MSSGSGAGGFFNEQVDDPAVLAAIEDGGGNDHLMGCVCRGLATKLRFLTKRVRQVGCLRRF